jgi:hypothetical protein
LKDDPLPGIDQNFGVAEFPALTDPQGLSTVTLVRPLDLPVANAQPVAIDLVTVVNPPSYSPRSIAAHNNRMLTVISTLTQMELTSGSISLTGFNTKHADMTFDYPSSAEIDWAALTAAFFRNNSETDNVSTERLLDPSLGLRFFRESLHEVIDRLRDAPRVLIVLSNAMQIGESPSRGLLQLERECDCRVYYLRAAGRDRDAIERLLQPLRPKVFDVNTARDFREAVAEIVRDLTTVPLLQP